MIKNLPQRPDAPLNVGVSRCLLGDEVRYDGSGAKSSLPHARLQGLFEFKDVCPEVGIGMSVPRPPIRLLQRDDAIRVVGVQDPDIDVTEALQDYATQHAAQSDDLAGFIFMHNSPSCGLYRVKVYGNPDQPGERRGRGMFAQTFTDALPNLPVEDAGRLFDEVLRENFVTRVFAYAHWLKLCEDLTPAGLVAFHSAYKYLLMAHNVTAYKTCGQIVSNLGDDFAGRAQQYVAALMQGLAKPATRKGHANVLSHLQGYLKRRLDSASRQELADLISDYRRGEQPLLAPMTLLRHHLRENPDAYVEMQVYLHPHPQRAALRRNL